jgi:chemotaxis protein histidine kinase CheA
LKGDSAACGLRELSELSHQFEDALSMEGAAAHTAVADIAFAAADIFSEMIAAYRKGHKLPSTKKLSKRIEELTSTPAAKKSRKKKSASLSKHVADWTEYEKLAMLQAQANGQDVLHVAVKIDPHCAMPIAGRQLIQNALSVDYQLRQPHEPRAGDVPRIVGRSIRGDVQDHDVRIALVAGQPVGGDQHIGARGSAGQGGDCQKRSKRFADH